MGFWWGGRPPGWSRGLSHRDGNGPRRDVSPYLARFAHGPASSGRLVAPFAHALNRDTGYYLVYPANRAGHPKIRIFRDWLLSVAREP